MLCKNPLSVFYRWFNRWRKRGDPRGIRHLRGPLPVPLSAQVWPHRRLPARGQRYRGRGSRSGYPGQDLTVRTHFWTCQAHLQHKGGPLFYLKLIFPYFWQSLCLFCDLCRFYICYSKKGMHFYRYVPCRFLKLFSVFEVDASEISGSCWLFGLIFGRLFIKKSWKLLIS